MSFGITFMINDGKDETLLKKLRKTYLYRDPMDDIKSEARAFLQKSLAAAIKAGDLPEKDAPDFVVEVPADSKNGDLAANLALVSAKIFGMAPRKIAEAIEKQASATLEKYKGASAFDRIEIAGPGFINLFVSSGWFGSVVLGAFSTGADYGRTEVGKGKKVNVEFVSANPTGPMHLGNARGGVMGDSLAEALSWAGYDVTREFLINDAGNQINKFGRSLAARYLELTGKQTPEDFPEDGYQGEDIRARAQEFLDKNGTGWAEKPLEELEQALVDYALPLNIQAMKDDLAKYRVEYDVWFSETSLHESGAVKHALDMLAEKDASYEQDGTVWYKATRFGAEKDEVLVRANGVPTYFAADIAYHLNKFERGFGLAIDIWGADHHGHVARMKGAMEALGQNPDDLDIVLMQFVSLVRDGAPVRMSKRTGKAITLTDLLDEVPIDSARFFFNMREPGSTIEFDLDLAVASDSNNPVYYVQYAHARICSIFRALEEDGVQLSYLKAAGSLDKLAAEEEKALIRQIAAFPGEIIATAEKRDPAKITRFAFELATLFHKFYTTCRIKGEEEGLQQARLALAQATRICLANALGMLKITVPEKM